MAQPFSDVTWCALLPGLLRQDGVCLARMHDLHEHVQRSTAHAEGDCECRRLPRVALQLSLHHAAGAPSNVMHREETARGLVDVHDAVCADSVLVHEPAQRDEQPVRVGVLLLRAVELFQALGGLLAALMPCRSCFTQMKRLKNIEKNDPDRDVFVFLGNKPVSRRSTSLTLQGDFCVLMIGRAALRCKKKRSQETCCASSSKEAKRRAAAHEMDLGRKSTLQQRIPREKEHTSTVDMDIPRVEYACRELTEPTPESEQQRTA